MYILKGVEFMIKALKIWKSKLFISLARVLLVGCIILLLNACVQCKIPKRVENHNVNPNAVPTVRTVILLDYSYKNRTYTNHFKSLPSKDIVSQIGVSDPSFEDHGVAVFKIKGVDVKKSIAIAIKDKDSTVYLQQAYNNRYWVDQLPKILIYSVLTIIFFLLNFIIRKI